jgi:hypothetical protein
MWPKKLLEVNFQSKNMELKEMVTDLDKVHSACNCLGSRSGDCQYLVTQDTVTFLLIVPLAAGLLPATWHLKAFAIVSTDNGNGKQMAALHFKGKEKPLTCICARRDPPLGLDVTPTGAFIMVVMVTP